MLVYVEEGKPEKPKKNPRNKTRITKKINPLMTLGQSQTRAIFVGSYHCANLHDILCKEYMIIIITAPCTVLLNYARNKNNWRDETGYTVIYFPPQFAFSDGRLLVFSSIDNFLFQLKSCPEIVTKSGKKSMMVSWTSFSLTHPDWGFLLKLWHE